MIKLFVWQKERNCRISHYIKKTIWKRIFCNQFKADASVFQVYANDQISQTLSDQFKNLPTVSTGRKIYLSCSHYLMLMRISSDVRKRQEVGRGLRLCVNQDGVRMDSNILGNDVHNINVLTVIASESYDTFAKGSMSSMQLRLIEESKIHCTREHFKAISGENVVYDVVDSYQALLDKVMK